ncbi:MAG: sensor domain-containing diguanylate cyclase [Oleispira sp.]
MNRKSYIHTRLPFVPIMLMVGLLVTIASIGVQYRISMHIEQAKTLELIEGQARLVAAIFRFDSQHSSDANPLGAKEATLSQLLKTFSQREKLFYSGEVLLAHRNEQLELILDYSPSSITASQPLSGVSEHALNLALEGGSGNIFGIDHRGQKVLVAYTPLPDLDRGLVAKVDIQELRKPFIYASLIATGVSLLIVALGSLLFNQIRLLKISSNKRGGILDRHSGIKEYERFFYLVIVMAVICITVNLCSAISLYHSSYERHQEYLLELISSQAKLIDSVAEFDAIHSQQDHPDGARGATLSQVIDAYSQSLGFGITGEYVIGHRSGDYIDIDFHQRHRDIPSSQLSYFSNEVEPMRQALKGAFGIFIGPNHLGQQVMAAYAPLQIGYGLVAKMDLAEIRAPFIRGSIVTGCIALCIIIIASVLLARMTRPFQKQQTDIPFINSQLPLRPTPISLLFFTGILILGILTFDIFAPLHIDGDILYVAVVTMGWWFPQRRHILILATVVTILSLTIFFINFEVESWESLINRGYSLFVVWVTALTLNLAKASDVARDKQAYSLKKLSLAVEHSPTGVMITDINGIIEYVNPSLLDNSEYSVEEMIGKSPNILHSGETPKPVFVEMWSTISRGKMWTGEIINRKKNGDLYWEKTSIFPILSEQEEVQNFVCLKENITQRKLAQEALQHKATHDVLTGLPNAYLGKDRLDNAIARARRETGIVAVLFIDLDGFKAVNDTFGHDIGDFVLQQVATRLKQIVREVDTVARIGGDEFLIILGDINQTLDAELVSKKIIHTLCQPFIFSENTIAIGSSIGIALYPEHGDQSSQLIKRADMAMYSIKRGEKNNYCFFDISE